MMLEMLRGRAPYYHAKVGSILVNRPGRKSPLWCHSASPGISPQPGAYFGVHRIWLRQRFVMWSCSFFLKLNHLQVCKILITCKFAPFLSKSSFATQCNFRTLHSTWLQPMFIFTLIGFWHLVCSFYQPGVYTAVQFVGEGIGIWSVPPENFVFRKGSITKLLYPTLHPIDSPDSCLKK